jgi:hypothetical protein
MAAIEAYKNIRYTVGQQLELLLSLDFQQFSSFLGGCESFSLFMHKFSQLGILLLQRPNDIGPTRNAQELSMFAYRQNGHAVFFHRAQSLTEGCLRIQSRLWPDTCANQPMIGP